MVPGGHFGGGVFDGVGHAGGQVVGAVDAGGGLLDQREGVDDADGHAFIGPEREVFERTLGLCPPIGLRGNGDGADAVAFDAGGHGAGVLWLDHEKRAPRPYHGKWGGP